MKKTVDIMDYCNKLFAADLFAGIVLEEDFDTGYDYTWSAAGEDWADKFRTELNGYISAGCCEERAADYRKALAILDEMEQAALFELPLMVYTQIVADNLTRSKPYRLSVERCKKIILTMPEFD